MDSGEDSPRPHRRQRLSGEEDSDDDMLAAGAERFGGSDREEEPAGHDQSLPCELNCVSPDPFTESAPSFVDDLDSAVKLLESLKTLLLPGHYHGEGFSGLIAKVFHLPVSEAHPDITHVTDALLQRIHQSSPSEVAEAIAVYSGQAQDLIFGIRVLLLPNRSHPHVQGTYDDDLNLLDTWTQQIHIHKNTLLGFVAHKAGDLKLVSDTAIAMAPWADLKPQVKLQKYLKLLFKQQEFRIYADKVVWQQVVEVIGSSGTKQFKTRCWKVLFQDPMKGRHGSKEGSTELDINFWVDSQLDSDPTIVEWSATCSDKQSAREALRISHELSIAEPQRHFFAFAHGDSALLYDIRTDRAYPMGEGLPEQMMVGGFHPRPFHSFPENREGGFWDGNWFDIPTALDQIVDARGQDFSIEVQRVYWAIAIGRMLFSKHDVFEYGTAGDPDYLSVPLKDVVTCFSMCCGLAKTGKSTSVMTISRIYNNNSGFVGVLESKGHPQFALEHLLHSQVIIAPELDEKFELGQTVINKMMAGEPMSVDRKNKVAQNKTWVAPLSAAGNSFWLSRKSNGQGQLARRVFLWSFQKTVAADSRLNDKIDDDLPAIIMKAVLAFKALVKDAHLASQDVTDYVGATTSYFQDVLKEMETDMTLRRFFSASGKVAVHPGASVSRNDLSLAYTQWCQETHHKPQTWNAETVADALSHMETKNRTNRINNQWSPDPPFTLQPKNDVGIAAPGSSERFYWGIGLWDDVVRLYPNGEMPADNPLHATSRQVQQQQDNREALQMVNRVTNSRRRREQAARAERSRQNGEGQSNGQFDGQSDGQAEAEPSDMAMRFL